MGGKFAIKSTFADLYKRDANGNLPAFLVAAPATGGTSLYNTVYAAEGRIGYVGPDVIPSLTDATKVAKVKGFSPDQVSVQATLTPLLRRPAPMLRTPPTGFRCSATRRLAIRSPATPTW